MWSLCSSAPVSNSWGTGDWLLLSLSSLLRIFCWGALEHKYKINRSTIMNQKDKESMWGGHSSLYATVGCVWVRVGCVVFWFCILHPPQGVCGISVRWVGKPCSSPQWKAVPGVAPTPWGCPSEVLCSSHSASMGIADSDLQMKHSALIFPFSSVTSKAQPCWAAPRALAVLMEGTGNCQQHPGACALSYHSSCFEGCRESRGLALGGEKGKSSGSELKQQEENPSHGHWRNA